MDAPDATPSLTLTRTQLVDLTGLRQPKRMCDWLASRGWVFEPPHKAGDVPKVDRAYYAARMSGQTPQQQSTSAGPDLSFMLGPQPS